MVHGEEWMVRHVDDLRIQPSGSLFHAEDDFCGNWLVSWRLLWQEVLAQMADSFLGHALTYEVQLLR